MTDTKAPTLLFVISQYYRLPKESQFITDFQKYKKVNMKGREREFRILISEIIIFLNIIKYSFVS